MYMNTYIHTYIVYKRAQIRTPHARRTRRFSARNSTYGRRSSWNKRTKWACSRTKWACSCSRRLQCT